MQKFVFHMLAFDVMPYSKRGSGLAKEGLSKAALQQLCVVHFEYLGSQKPTQREQKNIKMKAYPELWALGRDQGSNVKRVRVVDWTWHPSTCCTPLRS